MSSSNNKTSYLVQSQLPEFVRSDHPTFVEFVRAYYQYMEQEGEVQYVTKNFADYLDIDLITADIESDEEVSNPEYYTIRDMLYEAYLKEFPQATVTDRNVILKHAREFYRARGTEKSGKFLARAIYNKEAEFYYPKDNILKVSDGKWYVEKTLNIRDVKVDGIANNDAYPNFVNTTIRGETSNSTAIVEAINSYYDNGLLITELRLSGVEQDFENGEKLYTYFEEQGEVKELAANLFSGIITAAKIINSGAGYVQGASVPISSNSGSGGQIIISKVSRAYLEGKIKAISVVLPGAGFRANDQLLLVGGGGKDARANVLSVNPDETYHPSSYSIVASTIEMEANTPLNNLVFSNLNSANANTSMAAAMNYWNYDSCGPIVACAIVDPGTGYIELPTVDVISNTHIRSLGILGRMELINGGEGYEVGDAIEMVNKPGCYGIGGVGQVSVVDANGTITQIDWNDSVLGHNPGGQGYRQDLLPDAVVVSANGANANVVVTAILGDGELCEATANVLGAIEKLTVVSGGVGYLTAPTLDLSAMGDGTAQASANIVTGIYTYPGRYLNDDGQLSAYNFLQDRDYYQDYSYVIKIKESINRYRKTFRNLFHPAGTKMWGEYQFRDTELANMASVSVANTVIYSAANMYANLVFNIDAGNVASYNSESVVLNVQYQAVTAGSNAQNAFMRANGDWFAISSWNQIATDNVWYNLANTAHHANLTNGSYYTGGGIYFDGVNDVVQFPHNDSMNVFNGSEHAMTVISWFDSADAQTTYKTLLSKCDPFFVRGFELYQSGANVGVIMNTYTANNLLTITSNTAPNTWYQAAFTYDGGAIRGYINGQYMGISSGSANAFTDTADSLYVGALIGPTPNLMHGRIAITQMYGRVLSNTEIQQSFEKYRGRFGI